MKVFLSWSGERSKKMAEALKAWLPDVLQAIQPWISSQDISKGSRGLRDVAGELAESQFGIVCVTAGNQTSPWVNFEAGALSKQMDESLVVPLLLDIKAAQLTGPLAQFQATESASKEDMHQLMRDINAALGDSAISSDRLGRAFERNWPDLDTQLEGIRAKRGRTSHPIRSSEDMLEELLVLIRHQERRIARLDDDMRVVLQERQAQGGRYIKIPAEDRVVRVEKPPRTPFTGMTLSQLHEIGSRLGIGGIERMRKSQVIEALVDHLQMKGLTPEDVLRE
ncbi:TIR domain-containing protein [Streptomyces qaidamensis]|uniref:TIR domain-containing protein n=1 Tax=Streptomyces qaidamensis TaxID=1783515 RepID=UPI0009A06FD8|nr:TIR domain-containing protein [Streptomyces qaidamensis]